MIICMWDFYCLVISYWRELFRFALPPSFHKLFYNCYIMTPLETANLILGIVVSAATVISVIGMGVRWLTKHYFEEIKKELKPNSGSSLKDQVTRLEARMDKADTLRKDTHARVEKLEAKIDDLYDRLLDYLSKNGK